MLIIGTRPEAIKLAPVALALRTLGQEAILCETGQHPQITREALRWFKLVPDLVLKPKRGRLDRLMGSLIECVGDAIVATSPDRVIVQGDTSSAFGGALAAHLAHVPLAHVEAGLRSGHRWNPWPEEAYRKLIAQLADLHFAPTETAAAALRAENVPVDGIHVTGNTGLDALRLLRPNLPPRGSCDDGRHRILVTCHRRENFGQPIRAIASALREIAARGDVSVTVTLHPNPEAGGVLARELSGCPNIALLGAMNYPDFIASLAEAHLVLTDSGGVQEEAPALGVPTLVLRDTTERPEGIEAHLSLLVGTNPDHIVRETFRLLDDPSARAAMAVMRSLHGDGRAAERIATHLGRTSV